MKKARAAGNFRALAHDLSGMTITLEDMLMDSLNVLEIDREFEILGADAALLVLAEAVPARWKLHADDDLDAVQHRAFCALLGDRFHDDHFAHVRASTAFTEAFFETVWRTLSRGHEGGFVWWSNFGRLGKPH